MTLGVEIYRALHPVISMVPTTVTIGATVGDAVNVDTQAYSLVNKSPFFEEVSAVLGDARPIWIYEIGLLEQDMTAAAPWAIIDISLHPRALSAVTPLFKVTGVRIGRTASAVGGDVFATPFSFSPPIFYHDDDAAGQFHWRVINYGPAVSWLLSIRTYFVNAVN